MSIFGKDKKFVSKQTAITADDMNALTRVARAVGNMKVTAPLKLIKTQSAYILSMDAPKPGTPIYLAKALVEIPKGGKGKVELYKGKADDPKPTGTEHEAKARFVKVKKDEFVYAFQPHDEWECFRINDEEEDVDEPDTVEVQYFRWAYTLLVYGAPDSGTIDVKLSIVRNPGTPESSYREATVTMDIATYDGEAFRQDLIDKLGITTEEQQHIHIACEGPIKFNSLTYATPYELRMGVIGRDLTVSPGGFPPMVRVAQGLISRSTITQ